MNASGIRLIAAALAAVLGTSAVAATAHTEDMAGAPETVFQNLPGPDLLSPGPGPFASNQYFFVAGSAFHRWSSTSSVSYDGGGCLNVSAGDFLMSDIQLPEGSTLRGIRIYYQASTNATGQVGMITRRYAGDGTYTGVITGSSTGGPGYVSEYFAPATPPIIIDNFAGSYMISINTVSGASLCGARLFYDTP